MATSPAPSGPKGLSFAKVAASQQHLSPQNRVAVPTAMDRRAPTTTASTSSLVATPQYVPQNGHTEDLASATRPSIGGVPAADPQHREDTSVNKVLEGVKDMAVASPLPSITSTPSLVVNGSSSSVVGSQGKNDNGTSVSDDVSQPADSNSDINPKAPSLDGKSITSGTTFALDEKESLRPDDSASVKAAADDDEPFSVRGSLLATSRMGSDNARVHRLRIGDMPTEKRFIQQLLPEVQDNGVSTPQSIASSQQPPVGQAQALGTASTPGDGFNSTYGQNPDDKLLEAMKSHKDRLFLLKLEQQVIHFVQSSKEPYMDLPPNNSFCRMLTHKLADYYHMTHSFEAVQGAVRIYRTPFCRVPPSLASIVESETDETAHTPPPPVLPKKIMRRGDNGGSGPASTSASKATSEVGSDGKEKTLNKEKMTREEREEAYKRTRERIFGNSSDKAELTPETEDPNGISRASSVSGKEKSNLGKRGKANRHRRDDSESFESRSQFVQYFHPQTQMDWSPHYMPGNIQYNVQAPQPYQYQIPQPYQTPQQAYPNMVPGSMPNPNYQHYGNMPTYAPQSQTPPQPQVQPPLQSLPRFPSNGSMGPGGYGSPAQPVSQQQQWQPGYTPTPPPAVPLQYPNRVTMSPPQGQSPGSSGSMGGIPYAYGQLPVNANPHDPKSQHPIPGSYNRHHAFNPNTKSFVPSGGMNAAQTPLPYNMAAPAHGSPQLGSAHMAYNGYGSSTPPQPYMGVNMGGPGYGMSRQSSNNSLPPYHAPQHLPPHPPPPTHLPQMPHKPAMASQAAPAGPSPPTYSHLPNYGNPATLPQKPPTVL
ncbi:hypothetical protein GGR57DRAFT_400717 [Xylariaceae sp. FL1272]|nr:hypothetical protein GGR57DRAFT_400717 [Xylariaceae sp. FL1272]